MRTFDTFPRIANPALVISDGSNCHINRLQKFHRKDIGGNQAFESLQEDFSKWGFRWKCVGYLSKSYGPTMIWQDTRLR